eukprot:m.67288 g.67288  ORF g.67288 m.67288 type:complete len:69 (+) comp23791_c0_seq1:2079-2285(+)
MLQSRSACHSPLFFALFVSLPRRLTVNRVGIAIDVGAGGVWFVVVVWVDFGLFFCVFCFCFFNTYHLG